MLKIYQFTAHDWTDGTPETIVVVAKNQSSAKKIAKKHAKKRKSMIDHFCGEYEIREGLAL